MSAGRTLAPILALLLAAPTAGCGGTPRLLAQANVPGGSEVRWVAGDTQLAVSLLGSGVLVLDAATGHKRTAWRTPSPPSRAVHGLAVSARGETLAVATAESVRVFLARGLTPVLTTPGDALALALSDDGGQLAWSDGAIGRVLQVGTGGILSQGAWPVGRDAIAWGALLHGFAVPIGWSIQLLRGDTLSDVPLGPFEDSPPIQLAFSASGQTLAVLEAEGHVSFWDVAQDRLRWRLAFGGTASAEDFAISGDTRHLATSRGGRVRLMWAYRGSALAEWSPHGGAEVRDLAFTRDGRRLATVGADGHVRIWAVPASGKERG